MLVLIICCILCLGLYAFFGCIFFGILEDVCNFSAYPLELIVWPLVLLVVLLVCLFKFGRDLVPYLIYIYKKIIQLNLVTVYNQIISFVKELPVIFGIVFDCLTELILEYYESRKKYLK